MKPNQRRNLDAVSKIDDDIIEKQTKKRIHLLGNAKKSRRSFKKWYIMGASLAAAAAVVLGVVFLILPMLMGGGKQIPVYTGMTVSNEAPTKLLVGEAFEFAGEGNNGNDNNGNDNNGNHYGHYKGDCVGDREIPEEPFPDKPLADSLVVVGAAEERYYAKAGEDIYITVHINNPDSFEILSFTLNGEKYSSYMFEAGSDLQNLILKVNVGETEGVVDYTIDAIKYIDGTEIKDVRMEGDQTVNVGVYTDKQPTASVGGVSVGFNSVSFTVSGTDEMGLIADSNGKVEAVLYDGTTVIARKEISLVGGTAVTFDDLSPNTLYEYAVVATYDALDGKGFGEYLLSSQAFYTEAPLLFGGVTLTTTGLSFDVIRHANAGGATVESLLLSDGTTERRLTADATSADGLLPSTAYTLTATYRNGDRTETMTLEFTTAPLTYTVIHQLETLAGTFETVETVTEVITLGETVTAAMQTHVGFTAPKAQRVTGSLDQPLTVTYQYTRTAYDMTLVYNDGTNPVASLKFGSELPKKNREGFVFGGWFTDVECTKPIATVPAESMIVYAQWVDETVVSALSYVIENDGICVTGLKTDLTELVIPAYIGGVPVLHIGPNAFAGRAKLTSVRLPDTLETIGSAAFRGCIGITSLTIPERVSAIGAFAFEGLSKLTTIYYNAASISKDNVSVDMFSGAGSDGDGIAVIFGATVKVVPCNLFAHNGAEGKSSPNIKTATFVEESVCTDINGWAFLNCTTLQSVTFPSSLKKILTEAFRNTSLTSVVLPDGVTDLKTYAFADCTLLKDVTLSENLTNIGANAFHGCTAINALTIPAAVTKIESGVFQDCTALSTITFAVGSMLKTISANAFENVPIVTATVPAVAIACVPKADLEHITILDGHFLAANAFGGAAKLMTVTLPHSMTTMNQDAFKDCTALTDVYFGGTLAQWFAVAFSNEKANPCCYASHLWIEKADVLVLEELPLSADFVGFGANALVGFGALDRVNYAGTLADWCTINFANAAANPLSLTGALYIDGVDVTKGVVTIPEGVTSIGAYAFSGCIGITELVIHADVTTVGFAALEGCVGLERLTIPFVGKIANPGNNDAQYPLGHLFGTNEYEGTTAVKQSYLKKTNGTASTVNGTYYIPDSLRSVTVLGGTYLQRGAFQNCKFITSITLPESATSVQPYAFSGTGITNITLPVGIKGIYSGAFENCTALGSITIPAAVTQISQNAFKNCTALKTLIFAEGSKLETAGTNLFENAPITTAVVPAIVVAQIPKADLEHITILDGTYIAENAFSGAAKLKTVTLPDSLTAIRDGAFMGCTSLDEITIPENVKDIKAAAFENCTALTKIFFNAKSANNLVADTFSAAGSAGEGITVTFGVGVTRVPQYLFAHDGAEGKSAPKVKSVIFAKDGVCQNVGGWAFMNCTSLQSVTWPSSNLEIIYTYAFYNTALTVVELPASVTDLKTYAFASCTQLLSVALSENTKNVGSNAFNGCTALKTLKLSASVTKIDGNAFRDCTALTDVYFGGTQAQWKGITFGNEYADPCKYAKHLWIGGVDVLATAT